MVRTSKTSTPVPEMPAVVTPAEKAPKAVKKTSSKKEVVDVAPVAVVDVAPVMVADEAAAEVEASMAELSSEFVAKLQQLGTLFASLKSEYRALEKKWTRQVKVAEKQSSKRKRKTGNRSPSGFIKPTRISDELASFLEKPSGSEMARTEVTREINKYIRTHGLQDKDNGRKINPDKKLSSLLRLKDTDELTYFNLQKHMSPHFAKSAKAIEAAAVAAAAAGAGAV